MSDIPDSILEKLMLLDMRKVTLKTAIYWSVGLGLLTWYFALTGLISVLIYNFNMGYNQSWFICSFAPRLV